MWGVSGPIPVSATPVNLQVNSESSRGFVVVQEATLLVKKLCAQNLSSEKRERERKRERTRESESERERERKRGRERKSE